MHVDNDVGGVRDLLAAMLARRDQWLHFLGRSDAFDASQRQSLSVRLEAAFVLAVDEELAEIQSCVDGYAGLRRRRNYWLTFAMRGPKPLDNSLRPGR